MAPAPHLAISIGQAGSDHGGLRPGRLFALPHSVWQT